MAEDNTPPGKFDPAYLAGKLHGIHEDTKWLRENVVTETTCADRMARTTTDLVALERRVDDTNPRVHVTSTPAKPDTLGIVARVLALVIAIGTILGGVYYLAGDVQASRTTAAENAKTLKRLLDKMDRAP